jgi:hypothetical protein
MSSSKYALRLDRVRKSAGSLALWAQEGHRASEDTMAACEPLFGPLETLEEVLAADLTPDSPVGVHDLFRDWTWIRASDWDT